MSLLNEEQSNQLGPDSGTETEAEDDFLSSEHVRVVIRCRPLNSCKEKDGRSQLKILSDGKSVNITGATVGPRSYHFTCVADASKDQTYMFRKTGKHIVECALAGFNGAIVAYGQTGSGKTFTMQGPGFVGNHLSTAVESRGIIQSVCEMIFTHIQEAKEGNTGINFEVAASYLEIYNEKLVDLLVVHNAKAGKKVAKLNIREDSRGEIMVVGQTTVAVKRPAECYQLLKDGAEQRHVGSTKMNSESSRSHAVFTLRIEKKDSERGTRQISRLHLVDLAGSERQKGTGATGLRLKEASGINKSLSALGNVVNALAAIESSRGKGSAQVRVPSCRDSKLTFLLKDSLGGNSKLCIIATISPALTSLDETVSTLDFAKRCSAMRNEAVVNESLTEDVATLQAEVLRLQKNVKLLKVSLSKAKALEVDLRASARPPTLGNFVSRELSNQSNSAHRDSKDKKEVGLQTEEVGVLATGMDILKSVNSVDVANALDALVQRQLEGEGQETRVEKLCILLANAISREKDYMRNEEDLRSKAHDSIVKWRHMLKTNEDLIESLKACETELDKACGGNDGAENNPSERKQKKELNTLRIRHENNPETAVLRHRVASLESELENKQKQGFLSEEAEKSYEKKLSELRERWLDMLTVNNDLVIAFNEREKVLNEVREKSLEKVYGQSGERLRKDFELIQKESRNNSENVILRHRVLALEQELVEFAELSAEAQNEVLQNAHTGRLGGRSRTVEFATEIGEGDGSISEAGIMKSLNKIPASPLGKHFCSQPSMPLKDADMQSSSQTAVVLCESEQHEATGGLKEILESSVFRELHETSDMHFIYGSPRRISEIDGCLEALEASVQELRAWSAKSTLLPLNNADC